ncbi:MAG: T9SS type A sorting domain-containing protein, partial [Bacteroidia bacterium]
IYGSLTLSSNMTWSYGGEMYFEATSGVNTITSASQALGSLTFEGIGGEWVLNDSLTAYDVEVKAGIFRTQNKKVHVTNSFIVELPAVGVYLGTSVLSGGEWMGQQGVVHADSSTIAVDMFGGGYHIKYNNVITNNAGIGMDADSCIFNVVTYTSPFTGSNISGCTIDSLLCPNGLELNAGNNTINYTQTTFLGIGVKGNKFRYVEVNGGGIVISGNTTFDTLLCNNPGQIITLKDTITINNILNINASGGFPVSLKSDHAGIPATIFQATDTVCLNYIYMQDINATGGAQFYAGQYSSNISNNTGWQWTSCVQPISNVWPGDANYDLMTDNVDIIYIGLAYNQTGFVRPGASNTYTAQPCLDWNRVYTNNVNIKHADCDGNGVVDSNDTLAVSLNYGIANTGRMAAPNHQQSTGPDIYFAPTQPVYPTGASVSIPINLGTSTNPATDIYGLAFSIQYDASQIQPGSVNVTYNTSWLVNSGNIVHLEKDFYSSSHIDVGVSRTSHTDMSGSGTFATLNFIVSNTAVNAPINLSFSNITVMNDSEHVVTVNPIGNSVAVGIQSFSGNPVNIAVYPNPAKEELTIQCPDKNMEGLIIDVLGNSVKSIKAISEKTVVDVTDLQAGIYVVTIKTHTGTVTSKITIQH